MKQPPKTLIIDDDPIARQTAKMLLLQEGYDLAFAEGGAEALARLDELNPDVILLDVMMPEMDGFAVCRRLKAHEVWRHVPVILVTALDSKADLARGLEAGADDFVNKPINGLELRARVRSMLRIKQRHDELEATLQLREALSNMIMHDIRSPLATIQLYCDLLEARVDSPAGQEEVDVLHQATDRLNSFVTDMLLMAKMEEGQLVLNRTPVDVVQLAQKVHDSYAPLARQKGIKLVLDAPADAKTLSLDANLWQRVLDNLVSNAVKFSPAGGRVTVQVRYPAGENAPHLRLRVCDQGPGIPAGHRDTIFDKFKIANAQRRDVTQIGLGLAFCKLVVAAHDGQIAVADNHPHGAVFTVTV